MKKLFFTTLTTLCIIPFVGQAGLRLHQLIEVQPPQQEEEKIYSKVEVDEVARFQRRSSYQECNELWFWAMTAKRYPMKAFENAITGSVNVIFVVEKDGSIKNISFPMSPDKLLELETKRIFLTAPRLTPAELNGEKVRLQDTISIPYRIIKRVAEDDVPDNIVELILPYLGASDEGEFCMKSTKYATFMGKGVEEFWEWVMQNLSYPKFAFDNMLEGTVDVTFIVETDGSISHIKFPNWSSTLFIWEVLRVLENAPKWEPAEFGGEKVRTKFAVPIRFIPINIHMRKVFVG